MCKLHGHLFRRFNMHKCVNASSEAFISNHIPEIMA